MRAPVNDSDLEAVELSAATDARGQRAVAALLESWARRSVPGDSVSRARLLVAASEHSAYAGDSRRALRLARRALATGDHVAPDTRCYVVSALLLCGHLREALALVDEVLRDTPADAEVYELLGEELARHHRYDDAARVWTSGLFRCAGDEEATEVLLAAMRRGRGPSRPVDLRDVVDVREAAGVPVQAPALD
ncbi:hypothetical protein [Kineococcus arenarius]|uniref:hypothetical protein n=1 Tax=Kineococcus sp. SYSU DK007 TaxID=3383128 RepID=UPI003D7D3542